MIEIQQTDVFRKWWTKLKDERARGLIFARLDRMAFGHFGDVQPVGRGLSELRIHHGPGYRVYFCKKGSVLVLLLCGGDKSTQAKDIRVAQKLFDEWSE